jgi:hypothetical protein
MRDDLHELPTPRTTLQSRYVRVLVWCTSCRLQRDADLQALIDAGKGDVPLINLKFRCSNCGSRRSLTAGPCDLRDRTDRAKRGTPDRI